MNGGLQSGWKLTVWEHQLPIWDLIDHTLGVTVGGYSSRPTAWELRLLVLDLIDQTLGTYGGGYSLGAYSRGTQTTDFGSDRPHIGGLQSAHSKKGFLV